MNNNNFNSNAPVIKKIQEEDIENIMQIWLETNILAHDFINETYWKNQYDHVKKLIPESEIYVCEKSGHILGFIGLSGNYIAGLFVSSVFQSQGIGKRLIEYVRTFKKELSLNVYQKNIKAVSFYQREGFRIEAETMDENTGEKEYFMTMKQSTNSKEKR